MESINSMIVLRFARIERHQGTILETEGLSQLNVRIAFDTH